MEAVLSDPFWCGIRHQMATVGLAHQFRQIVSTGRLENFRRVAGGAKRGHSGRCYDDSDVYKWMEAASYAAKMGKIPDGLEEALAAVESAQETDGYIQTWIQLEEGPARWSSLCADHEAYCLGHLIEAGVAHLEATGSERMLRVAERAAACLEAKFGERGMHAACGHQEAEIALARLAAATGNGAYRLLGARMVSARGRPDSPFRAECEPSGGPSERYRPLLTHDGRYDGEYFQDHLPLEDCDEVVGHAVRAMYYFCGAMDCAPGRYDAALLRLWTNLTQRRMYVTGGIGSAGANEGFTSDYDLPNRHAYAETCAAIGLVMWARRMAERSCSSEAAGVMLRALYNAVLSGVSADACGYFYANPLESQGEHRRKPWYECACCPPNIARLVLSVEKYLAWGSGRTVVLAAPVAGEYEVAGHVLVVESEYPWGNSFTVTLETPEGISLRVADPFGGEGSMTFPDGEVRTEDGWLVCELAGPCTVKGRLGHSPEFVRSHPLVPENACHVATVDGPLVFCAEASHTDPSPNAFRVDTGVAPYRRSGGLEVAGHEPRHEVALYSRAEQCETVERSLSLVPYSTWANRGPSVMRVWLAEA